MNFLFVLLLVSACSAAKLRPKATTSHAWLLENGAEYSQIIFSPAKNLFFALANNRVDVISVSPGSPFVQMRFDLPLPGQMLAVHPDGELGAVAHNSYISFLSRVGLTPYVATFTVPVVGTSGLIVIDKKACLWPNYGQWTNIVCVNLEGDFESCSSSIYGGGLAFLHPSGSWVYSPNTGLSPQSVHKLATNSTCMDQMWDNPGWGDYYYGNHWWFSYDGSRAFLNTGMTVATTADQNTDMQVHGYFNASTGTNPHTWISQSAQGDHQIAGLKPDTSNITLYSWPYLMPTSTIPFPVPSDPRATNPSPQQVHFADDGRLYTVGKYGQSGELWGVGYIEFN